jgi:AICAR transformylase/IMP cyclohydrolase PurH
MPTYYVTAPGSKISAEIDAPDSRHARTTFLDYLSRSHLIPWNARQEVRKKLMTKRVEAGSVQTSVQLSYNAQETKPEVISAGPQPQSTQRQLVQPQTVRYGVNTQQPAEETQEQPVQEPQPTRAYPSILGNSPIANLSRRTGGE